MRKLEHCNGLGIRVLGIRVLGFRVWGENSHKSYIRPVKQFLFLRVRHLPGFMLLHTPSSEES